MTALELLRIQARANRLANHRLHGAMAGLAQEAFHAPRSGFFPSLAKTLNHLLAVDLYYVGALYGESDLVERHQAFIAADDVAELTLRQAVCDERLIAWCEAADEAALDAVVEMPRTDHVQRDRAGHVLAHLFMHQTHHRGQAHAMLSGTDVAPPQLDEFLMPSDARWRVGDMAALGWLETAVYGQAPDQG